MQGNCGRYIKEIHSTHEEILKNIDEKQVEMTNFLQEKRAEVLDTFDDKIQNLKAQIEKDEEKKKDNQYDFKEKERELTEHLETMIQVAQKIYNDNTVLMEKHNELKI